MEPAPPEAEPGQEQSQVMAEMWVLLEPEVDPPDGYYGYVGRAVDTGSNLLEFPSNRKVCVRRWMSF